MEYLKFILYGLIQGATEFIPVSSTAHLKIISLVFGIEDPGSSISAIIQLGSVFAIFWYFRHEFFNRNNFPSNKMYKSFFKHKLLKSILIGTIPLLFFGGVITIFIPNFFESNLRSNLLIAILSLVMALYMYIANRAKTRDIKINNHNYKDSFCIGIAQALAVIPGVSRSGITISTALLSGWERREAAKYSFLLGIPSISIASIVQFIFFHHNFVNLNLLHLLIGLISTFISSLFAIDFFTRYLSSHGMKLFIYYRFLFGILILLNL